MCLIRICLLYLVFNFHCYGSLDLDIYRHFCPYTKFCTNKSPVAEDFVFSGDQVPCCFPCYCDPQCWIFSDCCPDVKIPIEFKMSSKASCQFAHYLSDTLKVERMGTFLAKKYIIQDRCPFNSTGPIADKCREIFDDIPTLEDISVVSDNSHLSRVYKNKYCAECHDVKNITRWKARTGTGTIGTTGNYLLFQNVTHSNMFEYLLNSTEIQFLPTREVQTRSVLCSAQSSEITIAKCHNGTKHMGLDVHHECLNSDAPLYHQIAIPVSISHSNLFCYLCVTSTLEPDQKICNVSMYDSGGRQATMRLLIDLRPEDFSITTTTYNKDTTGLCTREEIYDKINDRCRRLHCAWYAPMSGNKCVLIGKVVPGIRFSFMLHLIVNSSLNKSRDEITAEEVRDLERAIQRQTKLFKCPFTVIEITKYVPKRSTYSGCFRIHIVRTITHRCPFEFLVHRLAETLSLSWQQNLNLGNQSFDIMANINFQPNRDNRGKNLYLNDYDRFYLVLLFGKNNFIRYIATVRLEMFPCPHILLNAPEYNQLLYKVLNKNSTITEIKLTTNLNEGFYAISKTEIVVCSATFLRLVNQTPLNLAESMLVLFVLLLQFIDYF